jgi:hypothetical protein
MALRGLSIAGFAVGMVALGHAGAASAGQGVAKSPAGRSWTPPKTAAGQPDLQGIWNFSTPTPLERPAKLAGKSFYSDEELAALLTEVAPLTTGAAADRDTRPGIGTKADVELAYNEFWSERGRPTKRTSLVIEPEDGRLPQLTPAALARQAARAGTRDRPAEGPEDRSSWERCISRGEIPRIPGTYNNNVQIIQTADTVVLHYEMIHETRIIPLDGRPHARPTIRQWMGDSRGHWEGNTLIVETTNFSDQTNFRGAGSGLHLVERFTRTDSGSLLYQFTAEDPATWVARWTAELPFSRIDAQMFEYACHEGNQGMVGILSGARAQERAEESKKGSR